MAVAGGRQPAVDADNVTIGPGRLQIRLTDFYIGGLRPPAAGDLPRPPAAVEVGNTSEVTLVRGVVEGWHTVGLAASAVQPGSRLRAERVAVIGPAPAAPGQIAAGVLAEAAAVELVDVRVQGAFGAGVSASIGGAVTATRLEVYDTRVLDDQAPAGVLAEFGGVVEVTGGALAGNAGAAVRAQGILDDGGRVRLTDVFVDEAWPRGVLAAGHRGLVALAPARIEVDGVVLRGQRDAAVLADGAAASVEGRRLAAFETVPVADLAPGGRALVAQAGARLSLTDVRVEQPAEAALVAHGADVTLERALFRDAARGLVSSGDEASLGLTDVRVERTGAFGLLVDGGEADLTRISLSESDAGLVVTAGSAVRAGLLHLFGNAIGRRDCADDCPRVPPALIP